jgi:hypothetical protein
VALDNSSAVRLVQREPPVYVHAYTASWKKQGWWLGPLDSEELAVATWESRLDRQKFRRYYGGRAIDFSQKI